MFCRQIYQEILIRLVLIVLVGFMARFNVAAESLLGFGVESAEPIVLVQDVQQQHFAYVHTPGFPARSALKPQTPKIASPKPIPYTAPEPLNPKLALNR